MTVARIRATWTGPQINGGGISDFYFFGSLGDEDSMCSKVDDLVATMANSVATGNSVGVESSVPYFEEGTGDLIRIEPATPLSRHNGGGSGEPLPPATQALIQWLTPGIVNNRRVRGRTFYPALTEASSVNGIPGGSMLSGMSAALSAYITPSSVIPVIWARPAPGRPGTIHNVDSAFIWTKFAVLRSRRD